MVIAVNVRKTTAIVQIDNPPVNALSQPVRKALQAALVQIENDPDIRAVVLTCAGRTFVAGADIKEFDQTPAEPHLPDLLAAIESGSKAWIAALHGTVLGGGLELAMACHARVADSRTRLGLPEVNLGLIPGAGGTVRLPRLIDPTIALNIIASGKPISALNALEYGLIDQVVDEDLTVTASNMAHDIDVIPTIERSLRPYDPHAFNTTKQRLERKSRGQQSITSAIQAVERSLSMSAQAALECERKTFMALKQSDQSVALRHIFFAERRTLSDPRCKGQTRSIETIGIVGGGTMGAGIAATCLLAHYPVSIVERDEEAAMKARERVYTILDQARERGVLSSTDHKARADDLSTSDTLNTLKGADLIIEAVFEDLDQKKNIFTSLDQISRPEAILATNTSYLDINDIGENVADPSRVIGLHFFSPAHIMKLLEIITPHKVSDDVIATCTKFSKRLGKIGVLAGVCEGFIGNRIMSSYRHEADILLDDGALPWDVDQAMRQYGFPMGVFEMQDMAGLDIAWAMRKRRAREHPTKLAEAHIADELCKKGWFGQKTDRGWYVYQDGQALPSEETIRIIEHERQRKNITPRSLSSAEIIERILRRMRDEAAQVLKEKIAIQASDIDVVMVNGYGFPRWRGGPMFENSQPSVID